MEMKNGNHKSHTVEDIGLSTYAEIWQGWNALKGQYLNNAIPIIFLKWFKAPKKKKTFLRTKYKWD